MLYEHSPWDYIADNNKMKTIVIIPTRNWKSIAKQDMQICKKLIHTQITSELRNKSQEILGNSLRYLKVKHKPHLWDVVRTILRGKFRMVNIKEGRHQVIPGVIFLKCQNRN